MEQVPQKPIYGLIGSGKAASHFAHYLHQLEIPVQCWSRRLQRGQSLSIQNALSSSNVILLLISDDQIENFYRQTPFLHQKKVVHFSGSLSTPLLPSAHPLMTFGPELHSIEFYRRIPFVLEKGREAFSSLLPGLPNPSYEIDASMKPLYHALCVLGGNFTTLLWQKLFEGMNQLGLPNSVGMPYMEAIFRNIAANPHAALTGPLARGDALTIDRNLRALDQDPYRAVYESFVRAHKETHS